MSTYGCHHKISEVASGWARWGAFSRLTESVRSCNFYIYVSVFFHLNLLLL